MSETTETSEADRALKSKHRAVWALGNYPAVATEVISELGPILAEAVGAAPGKRILDIAAGSGNAAIPAALTGAEVVASDLTPELLDQGRRLAVERGAQLEWREADAEALPFADGEFDAVMSCVGIMFAPHHQAAADELVRVCRPGGSLGVISWTPEGFIGQMFAAMKPYAPPPPPDAQPPPLWGSEEHVRGLVGDRVTDVEATRRSLKVDGFADPQALRDYLKANYGPTIAAYRGIADDPAKVEGLDGDLIELGRRFGLESGTIEWEYLLFTARRSS